MKRSRYAKHWRVGVWMLLCCLCSTWWRPAERVEAQIAVVDVDAIFQLINTVTELGKVVGNQVLDLTAYIHLAEVVGLADDLLLLSSDLEAFGGRLTGRSDWWRGTTIPRTIEELSGFSLSVTGQCYVTAQDGYGVQSLIRRITGLLVRVSGLVSRLNALSGSVAGLQVVTADVSALKGAMSALVGMMGGVNETALCRALQENVARQSVGWIRNQMLSDWGAYTPIGDR